MSANTDVFVPDVSKKKKKSMTKISFRGQRSGSATEKLQGIKAKNADEIGAICIPVMHVLHQFH